MLVPFPGSIFILLTVSPLFNSERQITYKNIQKYEKKNR